MNISSIALHRAGVYCLLLSVAALWATASASAGVIVGATPFLPSPGLGTVAVPAIITVVPSNDDVPAPGVLDNNIFVPIKRFDFNGYIDIEFTVVPDVLSPGGVTEYQVFESVDNNTGTSWIGYNMYLGFGVGPAWIPSLAGDGLDFDAPIFTTPPVSSAMGPPALGEDALLWSGGVHGAGAETYLFRVDVPDIATLPPLFSSFTLRQIPVAVPEPSTVALVGLVFISVAAIRRRG
jgi:hypothetical protein